MSSDNDKDKDKGSDIEDIESLIDQKERLDSVFKQKFARTITVMFTDLKGSTTITETEGDFATRIMLKHHNDALLPVILGNNGILVKTMGDGTMSYFANAQDAVRAAVHFQVAMDRFNLEKRFKVPILVRIGINTGEGIVEKNDIYGDVVNVASRFESTANPGEIYLSESTYNAMTDKSEIYCRFIKTATLKGKKEPFKVYKAFWNKEEIEADKSGAGAQVKKSVEARKRGLPFLVKLLLFIMLPAIIVFLLIKAGEIINKTSAVKEKRSLRHSVDISNGGEKATKTE